MDLFVLVVQVKEAVGFGRIDGSFEGCQGGAADGAGRQAFIKVGVIRRLGLVVGRFNLWPPVAGDTDGVLGGSVDLQIHILVEAVPDDAGDKSFVFR